MITAERKPMEEIIGSVRPYRRILLVGCNECVTVCAAGGRKEVGLLSSALKMHFQRGKNPLRSRKSPWKGSATPNTWKSCSPDGSGGCRAVHGLRLRSPGSGAATRKSLYSRR